MGTFTDKGGGFSLRMPGPLPSVKHSPNMQLCERPSCLSRQPPAAREGVGTHGRWVWATGRSFSRSPCLPWPDLWLRVLWLNLDSIPAKTRQGALSDCLYIPSFIQINPTKRHLGAHALSVSSLRVLTKTDRASLAEFLSRLL